MKQYAVRGGPFGKARTCWPNKSSAVGAAAARCKLDRAAVRRLSSGEKVEWVKGLFVEVRVI